MRGTRLTESALERARKVYRAKLWMLPLWWASGRAHTGVCPICEGRTIFVKYHPWLRDNYRCVRCWSIPRQRAIIKTLTDMMLDWVNVKVHESSPCGVSSDWIERRAASYIPTHYYPDMMPGSYKENFRCENLEAMTFDDNEFDLTITQDVMEHVLDPVKAFQEISRTLKPGGTHVFTVPIYSGKPTLIRAVHSASGIDFLETPDYHGNPIDENGSLVAREWGDDIVEFIEHHTKMPTVRYSFNNPDMGLEAAHLDVIVSTKPKGLSNNAL